MFTFLLTLIFLSLTFITSVWQNIITEKIASNAISRCLEDFSPSPTAVPKECRSLEFYLTVPQRYLRYTRTSE